MGHEATEQFGAEGMTAIGRLYPSTSETAQLNFQSIISHSLVSTTRSYRRNSRDSRRPVASILLPSQAEYPTPTAQCVVWQREVVHTVPLNGSHWSPPLHPPSRHALGPIVVAEKLQSRRP